MNTERLTTKSREVISAAVAIANQRGHATVESWHLLLALLDTGGSTATALLRAAGANPADVRRAAVKALDRLPSAKGSSLAEPTLAREFVNAIGAAEQIARPIGDEYTSTEHLLAGLARVGGAVAQALRDAGATEDSLVAAFPQVRGGERRVTNADPEATYKALEKYGVDLTGLARDGKIDPVIGRDPEIRRVIQVLSRRTKNNPVDDDVQHRARGDASAAAAWCRRHRRDAEARGSGRRRRLDAAVRPQALVRPGPRLRGDRRVRVAGADDGDRVVGTGTPAGDARDAQPFRDRRPART